MQMRTYSANEIRTFLKSQGATDIIIGFGRFIGIADLGNAYQYQLSLLTNKKSYIGSLADTV